MLDALLAILALLIVSWLFERFKRHHTRLMTELHAQFDDDVKALRAEVAGLRLYRGSDGR